MVLWAATSLRDVTHTFVTSHTPPCAHMCVSPQGSVHGGLGLHGRTVCDRVIRACNHQLGAGSPDHAPHLVRLVEVSLRGYDLSSALGAHGSPLYMEKILFHILKKLSSLEAHDLCSHVAGLLHCRLIPAQQVGLVCCEPFTLSLDVTQESNKTHFGAMCCIKKHLSCLI